MEKAGRRPLLLLPMCAMVVSFLILTICLNLLNNPDYEVSIHLHYEHILYALDLNTASMKLTRITFIA